MNGFSLLLTFASLSVVYSWRAGVDQQQEYVLQIEPEIVQALAAGEEIFSDIPADAGPFARLCISILPKDGVPARHTAAADEQFRQLLISSSRYASRDRNLVAPDSPSSILWPGRAGAIPEQSYGVTTGWQPDAAGNQQYLVQIDPTVLSSLSIGDELYVPVDPAAGRLTRFVVKSGRSNLPRLGGLQTTSQGPAPPLTNVPGRSNWTNSSAPDLVRSPSRFNNNNYVETPIADSRGSQYTSPQAGSQAPIGLQNPAPLTYGALPQTLPNANSYPPANNYPSQPPAPNSRFDQYRGPQPASNELAPPPGYVVQPVASQQPQLPQPQRQFNSPNNYPEARVAGLPTTSVNGSATVPLNGNILPGATTVNPHDKPWGPLLFVTFALFFSIGGNLYLAYTALEFHSRYRSAIERLRSAARSS
jgi:hypothetical protein